MTPLNVHLRLSQVRVSDMRTAQMGVTTGIKSRFTLEDETSVPLAFVICHKFSPRTYKLLDALYASMEQDVVDILARPEGGGEDLEYDASGQQGDDDGGLSFP